MTDLDETGRKNGLAWSRGVTIAVGCFAVATAIWLVHNQREIGLSNAALFGLGIVSIALPWIQSFKWGKDGFELVTAQKTTTSTLDGLQKSVEKLNRDFLELAQSTKKIAAEVEALIAAQPPGSKVEAVAAQASWMPTLRTLGEIVESATANTQAIQKVAGAVSALKGIVYDTDPKA